MASRTRHTDDSGQYFTGTRTWYYDKPGYTEPYVEPWGNYSGLSRHTGITDVTGPRPPGRKNRAVSHFVYTGETTGIDYQTPWYGPPGNRYRIVYNQFGRESYGCPSTLWGPPSVTATAFNNAAIASQVEQIPVAMSLPNFLLDLDDLPRLLSNVRDIWKIASNRRGLDVSTASFKKSLTNPTVRDRVVKWWSKNPSSDPTKLASDFTLAWNFGVKPLIADISASLGLLDSVRNRIAHLKRTYGKVQRYRRFKRYELPSKGNSAPFSWSGQPCSYCWVPGQAFTTYGIGFTYVQTLAGLEDANREIAAITAALGFNRPLSVVWDAIPYSFLVDYVSNVGDILSRYQSYTAFEGEINVLDGWTSTKKIAQCTLCASDDGINNLIPVSNNTSMDYNRNPGAYTNRGLVLDTNVSGIQMANIAALVRAAL